MIDRWLARLLEPFRAFRRAGATPGCFQRGLRTPASWQGSRTLSHPDLAWLSPDLATAGGNPFTSESLAALVGGPITDAAEEQVGGGRRHTGSVDTVETGLRHRASTAPRSMRTTTLAPPETDPSSDRARARSPFSAPSTETGSAIATEMAHVARLSPAASRLSLDKALGTSSPSRPPETIDRPKPAGFDPGPVPNEHPTSAAPATSSVGKASTTARHVEEDVRDLLDRRTASVDRTVPGAGRRAASDIVGDERVPRETLTAILHHRNRTRENPQAVDAPTADSEHQVRPAERDRRRTPRAPDGTPSTDTPGQVSEQATDPRPHPADLGFAAPLPEPENHPSRAGGSMPTSRGSTEPISDPPRKPTAPPPIEPFRRSLDADDDEDLERLATKIEHLLEREARRHGLDL